MKITLIDVTSLDGKLTKWHDDNIYHWSSPEDFSHFQKIKAQHTLLVMGSGVFNAVKANKDSGFTVEKDRLRIVMTKTPENYQEVVVPGQLEFTNESPKELVKRLEENGYTKMLLLGGSALATSFFIDNLIDDLVITIEPKLFGMGKGVLDEEQMDISLQLLSTKKLNKQGTLLLHYKVL